MDKGSCFHVTNNANINIYTYAAYLGADSLLPLKNPDIKTISPKKTRIYYDIDDFQDHNFKRLKKGEFITVFFFNKDTIDQNDWFYIRESTFSPDSQVTFGKDKGYDLFSASEVKNDLRQHFTENKQINGITYSGVWEVEDLSVKRRINRFVKVDYHGIIEFHDKQTGLTWTQVNKDR